MKVNCLGCGFKVDLAGSYDDYAGPIKCFACGKIMEIATQEGNVRAVRFAALPAAEFAVFEIQTQARDSLQALRAATEAPASAGEVSASAVRSNRGSRSTRANRTAPVG
ncbi:MAG: hypothetical protein ABSH31_18670 [Bryobacteraceae bacterium]|jgi:hypothetical protein